MKANANAIRRREFLRRSGFAAGLAPFVAADLIPLRAAPPSEKLRLGLIGCGGMGAGDLECFFLNPEVECVVVCDVDDAHLARGVEICDKKRGTKPGTVKDFRRVLDRKDVDAVLIATPDHWHALPAVMACQAGKDVYVEKPLARTIDEGRAILEASRRHQRVVQMGSQWRSCRHIIEAAAMVRSGKLGKVSMVRGWAYLDGRESIGRPPDGQPPAGVDYQQWLGPAPARPFNPNRFHFNFRWFWDYAGGLMTDWGVHLINMLMMGMDDQPPRTVSASGGKLLHDDNTETPDTLVTVYEFPGCLLIWEHRAGLNNGINGRSWGVEWCGTEGTIILNDEGWEVRTEPKHANLDNKKMPGSGDPRPAHVRNFLECVKSRKPPVLNLEIGHRVSTVAHLGNLAYRSGRKIVWDAVNERVVGDPEADKLVGAVYRKPWKLPYCRRA